MRDGEEKDRINRMVRRNMYISRNLIDVKKTWREERGNKYKESYIHIDT